MTKSMMFRINILVLLILANLSFGQTNPEKIHWIGGKKFVSYKIQAKDTWTALASRYAINIKDLQKANEPVTDLKIGQSIYVPADKNDNKSVAAETKIAVTSKPAETKQATDGKATYHIVAKGETLYRISKMYNQSVDDIKKWNNLTSDNVPVGKSLIVGKGNAVVKTEPVVKEVIAPVVKTEPAETKSNETKPVEIKSVEPKSDEAKTAEPKNSDPAPTTSVIEKPVKAVEDPVKADPSQTKPSKTDGKDAPYAEGTVEKITETGVATWMVDQELNQNKFYALHRTAPIGTIIKVTNRMTNNSVFVKVVGLLPDTGDNANIIIKITQAAAQRIGAIDQKFTAELSYGITH